VVEAKVSQLIFLWRSFFNKRQQQHLRCSRIYARRKLFHFSASKTIRELANNRKARKEGKFLLKNVPPFHYQPPTSALLSSIFINITESNAAESRDVCLRSSIHSPHPIAFHFMSISRMNDWMNGWMDGRETFSGTRAKDQGCKHPLRPHNDKTSGSCCLFPIESAGRFLYTTHFLRSIESSTAKLPSLHDFQ